MARENYHFQSTKTLMFSFRSISCYLLVAVISWSGTWAQTSAGKRASEEEWISIFNGKNLEGWDIKITGHDLNVNVGNTFRVEDSLLKGTVQKNN